MRTKPRKYFLVDQKAKHEIKILTWRADDHPRPESYDALEIPNMKSSLCRTATRDSPNGTIHYFDHAYSNEATGLEFFSEGEAH